MKIYTKKIEECCECPNIFLYTIGLWLCKRCGDKEVHPHKIPDWCPLEDVKI